MTKNILIFLFYFFNFFTLTFQTLSNPLKDNNNINSIIPDYQDVKITKSYYNMTPILRTNIPLINHNLKSCEIEAKIKWSASVGSSIYTTPVIFPSNNEGKKQIYLNTFYQYVEVLGHDGYKPWGFPLGFSDSSFQTSPILYDIDGDGVNDMTIIDKNANIYWVRLGDYGQYLEDYHVQVPKLKVRKDWADGMDPAFLDSYVMTSMFDNRYEGKKTEKVARPDDLKIFVKQDSYPEQKPIPASSRKLFINEKNNKIKLNSKNIQNQEEELLKNKKSNHWTGRVLMDFEEEQGSEEGNEQIQGETEIIEQREEQQHEQGENEQQGKITEEREQQQHEQGEQEIQLDENNHNGNHEQENNNNNNNNQEENIFENNSYENANNLENLENNKHESESEQNHETNINSQNENGVHKEIQTEPEEKIIDSHEENQINENSHQDTKENHGDLDGVEYFPPQFDEPSGDINPINGGDPFEWTDDYNVHAHRHWERRAYFGDDYLPSGYGWGLNDTHFAFVDPHVLAPATLADINNDGDMELIIPISYYFDKEQYRGKKLDFDPENFIAGGIGCWNVRTEQWNWLVHLDLTTDKTKFKALIHASPTVVDLDGDGRSEVIIGTSLGLLYVLDGDTGFSRRFFPMQFHEIQSQVVVADIRGGTDLEMIVGDLAGNLVCVNIEGDILWDARLSGGIYQPATVGDIDGDGQLDVVVSVSAFNGYHIYALRGDTGEILPGYPIALPEGGEVSGAIILVDLHKNKDSLSSSPTPLNPNKYSDPHAPHWTLSSVGHAPAAAPSTFSDILKKEEKLESEEEGKESKESKGEEELKKSEINENEIENENEETGTRRLDNLDPLAHKLRTGNNVGNNNNNNGNGGNGGGMATKKKKSSKGLHLLVPSFDGHLYIFDGKQTCAERIDIGDHIYSTPLVDDITGDGNLDIIIGTVNGHLHVLETQIPHHPLNTWSSFPKHRGNVFTHGQVGISIPLREKKLLRQTDIKGGNKLSLTFDIWDVREIGESETRKYDIIITRGTNKAQPIFEIQYTRPGRYTVELDLSPPEKLNLIVGMYTDHQQYYEDSIQIELSTRFYIWIKYLIVIPLMILVAPLLFMRPQKGF